MKAFTAVQHVLSALFIFVMAAFWAVPIAPALKVFDAVNAYGGGLSEWSAYLVTGMSAALAFITWGLCLLLLSGIVQMIIHPRVPPEGKVVPLFSGTTIRWAACGVMHRATKPFLVHVCPSIFANTYYRLAGVKLGQDSNLTSQDINDPFLVRVGSDTVVGGNAAINGHIVERGELHLAPVTIGSRCVVGGGSIMMPGSTLSDDSVLANRAVLPKHKTVPAGQVWAGVPATFVKHIRGYGETEADAPADAS